MISMTHTTGVAMTLIALALPVQAQAKRKISLPGRRAIVFDERVSALRTKPDMKAQLEQRLRRGRVVGIIGEARDRSGSTFLRVAVSRNTRGWLPSEAVARSGNARDAERLLELIGETDDDFNRAKLARLCADEFRLTKFAPRCLSIIGETAEKAAARLTRDAKRRIDEVRESKRKNYFLNFTGLDRYNRIGVTFNYDGVRDELVYDGAAYRELLRRYAGSTEAKEWIAKHVK